MDTGVGIPNPLFFIGVVENNVDERLEGRVQVRAFGVHGTVQQVPTEDLPWATLIHGSYDPNGEIPSLNSFVFGFFVDGRDAQQPMILGLIPTQMTERINPDVTGWGKIPETNSRILSKRSLSPDIGQPSNSRLARGEYIEETYVLQQEMSRVKDIPIADSNPDKAESSDREFFAEPAPAYNTQYPFNRVIETANHSIELDDTPGAERITIYHGEGSYIAIDARGSTTHKSKSDKFQFNDRNNYVYVKGRNIVTIEGDSQVYVKGNKIEEITGDLIQNVRGNHLLSVGGQSTLNASEEVQIRGAKLRLESNVENINLNANKSVNLKSVESINIKSETIYIDANGDLNVNAEHPKISGQSKVSIDADVVAIDDFVHMAMGEAVIADRSGAAGDAEKVEAPEPVGKSISTTRNESYDGGMIGSSGYTSQDEGEESVESAVATETSADAEVSNRDQGTGQASNVQDVERTSSSGNDIVEVIERGAGYNVVRLADGSVIRQEGTRAWRNNNPGNIEFGPFAESQGAIGTDGRFAIFPDYETGRAAKEKLLFGTNSYKDLTLTGAINRYAPSFENNTSAYISNVAEAAGVSPSTKMSNIPSPARTKILDAFERQEGFRPGRTISVS